MGDVDWSSYATTIVRSDGEAIRHITCLNLGGVPFDLDPTYSKGVFWKGLPQPLLKYDLHPQSPDVLQGDARCLPLPDQSVNSVMFDPPFVAKNTTDRTPNGKNITALSAQRTIEKVIVCERYSTPPLEGEHFWNTGSGFAFGDAWNAYARDFPAGAKIVIETTITVVLPGEG